MLDSHCHLHDHRMLHSADAAIERARRAGVTGFVLAGVDPDGWRDEDAICARHQDVHKAYGLHPQIVAEWADERCDAAIEALRAAIAASRPVAIGEIGLDAFTPERRATLDR